MASPFQEHDADVCPVWFRLQGVRLDSTLANRATSSVVDVGAASSRRKEMGPAETGVPLRTIRYCEKYPCLLASDLVEPPGVESQTDKHRHQAPEET